MNEFKVELFIDNEEEEDTELSNLCETDMEQLKINMEARALSKYYSQKVKISSQKI